MQEKRKEQSKRITAHNKMIRQLRAKGELKPLGTETYHSRMEKLLEEAPYNRERKRLTANGSVLPNKLALWPDDDYCNLCY